MVEIVPSCSQSQSPFQLYATSNSSLHSPHIAHVNRNFFELELAEAVDVGEFFEVFPATWQQILLIR